MADKDPAIRHQKLRTVDDISSAIENLYNRQNRNELDAKAADGLNTTIKSAIYLNVKLPMDAYKIFVTAAAKKIVIPEGLRKALPIALE
jgi:hypothetical protein